MEAINKENKVASNHEENKKGRGWGKRIFNFLAMGGIILVIILGVVIFILINYLINK